jgi:hypothetical protein
MMQGVFPSTHYLNISTIQMVRVIVGVNLEISHAGENLQLKKEVPSGEVRNR